MSDAVLPWQQPSVPRPRITPEQLFWRIEYVCSEEEGEYSELISFAYSQTLKLRVELWCKWFAEEHPTESDAKHLAVLDFWDGDFRIIFLAYPGPGARLLCFAEACYRVDKAICGTSKEAVRECEKLKAMDPLKYLFSEELITWWEMDLCQLFDDIEEDKSNRLVSLVRVEEISDAVQGLLATINDRFCDHVFTELQGEGWTMSYTLQRNIYRRCNIVQPAQEELQSALYRSRQRMLLNTAMPIVPSGSGVTTSYQNLEHLNEGIRRRIPSIAISGGNDISNRTEEAPSAIVSDIHSLASVGLSSEIMPESPGNPSLLILASSLGALGRRLGTYVSSNGRHSSRNKILDFLIHRSTVLCLTLCLVSLSMALITVSIIHAQADVSQVSLDSNFYSTFSQAMLSLLTIYLTILPPLRSRSLNLRYRSWFWLCLLFSAVASVFSLAVYISQQTVSLIFAYGSGFAQVVSTLLLVECVERAVNAGVISGLEMN